jgi:GNAT superfamily N-acetyltransferase
MPEGLNPAFEPALLSRIEDAGLNASAPPQQRWLDGWLVRFSPGKAKRARCINAVAEGRTSVSEKLTACAQLFDASQLPMIVRITPFTVPISLDSTLAQQGMERFDDTRVMVLSALAADEAPAPANVSIDAIGLEAFAQRVGGFRRSPLAQRQAHAERLLNSPVPFRAFELRADAEVVACGQIAVEGDLVGLYDVFTAEAARGRGFAKLLCGQLLAFARSRGARHAYLQVESDNHAARAVYRCAGFVDAYAYHYRACDPQTT